MDIRKAIPDLCCAIVLSGKTKPNDVIRALEIMSHKGDNSDTASAVLQVYRLVHTQIVKFLTASQDICWGQHDPRFIICMEAALGIGVNIASAKPRPSKDNRVLLAEPEEKALNGPDRMVLELIWGKARTNALNKVGDDYEVKQDAYKRVQQRDAGFDVNAPGLSGLRKQANHDAVQDYIEKNKGVVRKPRSSWLTVTNAAEIPGSSMRIVQLRIARSKASQVPDEIDLSRAYWAPRAVALYLSYITKISGFMAKLAKMVRDHMKSGPSEEKYQELPTDDMKELCEALLARMEYVTFCKENDYTLTLMSRFGVYP